MIEVVDVNPEIMPASDLNKRKATILIADDDHVHRKMQKQMLDDEKYSIYEVDNGLTALKAIEEHSFDVVLLDKCMPGLDGDEVCKRIRTELNEKLLPIIMVTGNTSPEDLAISMRMGANDFVTKPYNVVELLARVEAAIERKRLTDQLDNAETILFTVARMVEAKDKFTGDHCARLSHIAAVFGKELGLSDQELIGLRRGAILHDIGKLGIPESILLKNGKLTQEEFEAIKQHPVIGEHLCSGLKSMNETLPIIRHHHERWNGTGYPDGLKGKDIPYLARVFQVIDVYDALSSKRSYKEAFSNEKIIEIFEEEAKCGWYDPELMSVFLGILKNKPHILSLPEGQLEGLSCEKVFARAIA